jgi:tetratricopeptide (TPR) repeat protein
MELGIALNRHGQFAAAEPECRAVIARRPDAIWGHLNLAVALRGLGRSDQALAACREAIRRRPTQAEGDRDLGITPIERGEPTQALVESRRASGLAAAGSPVARERTARIRDAERQVGLDERLMAVIRGHDRPRDAAEQADLARIAYRQGLHAAAARLLEAALVSRPALAEDLAADHRYDAACAAALAGGGRGEDDPAPGHDPRAGLRA